MKLSGSRRHSPGLGVCALVMLAVAATGCAHKIGDSCAISTDCSVNGDRLCDTTQPDGYCTVFNCEPDKCPSGEGVCLAFTDGACDQQMVAAATSLRFQRTFCMKPCDNDGDCRAGYRCLDENEQTQLGA